jgi:hypothetical protein
MRPKSAYLVLCIAGTVIPLAVLTPWVQAHGLDLRLMVAELFANHVGAFFGLDVIVSAVVVIVWALVERSRRLTPFWWAPILATLAVGVSCGLPLLLFLKQFEPSSARSAARTNV